MTTRALGLVLLWLGTLVLVAILQYRLRRGAFRVGDEPVQPVGRYAMGVAVTGLLLTAAGTVLAVWDMF